jgi:hypothetical protein
MSLWRVQIHFIFPDNIRILCLYCNVMYAKFTRKKAKTIDISDKFPMGVSLERSAFDQYLLSLSLKQGTGYQEILHTY